MKTQSGNCLHLIHAEHPYYDYHTNAFEQKYNKVTVFNYIKYSSEHGIQELEEKIDTIIEQQNITHIILFQWFTDFVPRIEYLHNLRKKVFVISWLFDDDVFFHTNGKYYNQAVDAVVTTDYYGKIMYEQLSIPSVLYISSYDKNIYKPLNTIKDIDVSFVGWTNKSDRAEYLQYLVDNGINVEIYGNGSKNGKVTEEKMIEIFNRSKINLNFTKIGFSMSIYEDNPLLGRIRQNKGRPVEIGLTNSFCLSEHAAPLNKLFENNEIDTFDSKEELLEKVKFYLGNQKLREEYSTNLYNKCISNYESSVYFNKVFEKLDIIEHKKNYNNLNYYGIHKSRFFKIREKSWHLLRAKEWLKRKNFKLFKEHLSYVTQDDLHLLLPAYLYGRKKFGYGKSK